MENIKTQGSLMASCLSKALGEWLDTYSDKEIHRFHEAMQSYADRLPNLPTQTLPAVQSFFTREDMEQSMRYGFTLGSDGVKFKDALSQFNNSFNDILNIKK